MALPHALLFVAITACTVEGVYQRRLYSEILKHSNPLVRPVYNDSDALTVEFGLSLMQIIDVDEKNQILTTNIWLNLRWNDYYLQWNTSEYPGVPGLTLPDKSIGSQTSCSITDERFDATFHTNIFVSPTGICSYIPPGIFKSTCHIDVRWFPFDVQKCDLKFGSWTYGGWSLDLKMQEADISEYVANGEWDLVEVTGKKNERIYACCEEPYPDITFTLVLRRRTLYYGLNLLIPCVLISTLALLVFLLPADAGEKISLGITVLLSLTVFMLLVAEIMPATSDSVPLIAQYFATTMVIVGLSVIATVVVLQYHHHDPSGSKMSKWTRVILLNWCAWFLRMKRPGEDRVRSACHNKDPQSSLTSMDVSASGLAPPPNNGNVLYIGMAGRPGEDDMLLPAGQSSSAKNLEPELLRILEEVRFIAKRFRDQDEHQTFVV
ncbi:hypothetical protein INR49_029138 [Caranx melampygus]|nr:hypothetical protein INR49_029138 [Caranx melampygus]